MEKIGLSHCQWVIVKHSDTETLDGLPRPHFHLVANRVQPTNYKVVSDWRGYRRSEVAIRDLEKELGLIQVQLSWELERIAPSTGYKHKAKREGATDESIKIQLQQAIDTATFNNPTMPELIKKLKGFGVKAQVHFQSTGRVQGLTYEMDGITFSGTKIGKAYTFGGLQKYRGVTYNWHNCHFLMVSACGISLFYSDKNWPQVSIDLRMPFFGLRRHWMLSMFQGCIYD